MHYTRSGRQSRQIHLKAGTPSRESGFNHRLSRGRVERRRAAYALVEYIE